MPTSSKTNQSILTILLKYLTIDKLIEMFIELNNVDGNSSFKTSINTLLQLLQKK